MSKNYWLKIFLVLVVLLALCTGGFVIYLTNSSDEKVTSQPTTAIITSPSPSIVAEPKTAEAVQAKMQMFFDLTSAGDYEPIYNMYDSAVKNTVSKADLIKLFETCNVKSVGVKYTVSNVRVSGNKAMFDVRVGMFPTTSLRTAIYEDGAWRYQMTPKGLNSFKDGIDAKIAKDKASGDC